MPSPTDANKEQLRVRDRREDAPGDDDLVLADGKTTGGCFNIDEGWLGFLFAAAAAGSAALPLPNT